MIKQLVENARKVMSNMSVTQRLSLIMTGVTVFTALGIMVYIGSLSQERGYVGLPIKVEPGKDFDDIKKVLDEQDIKLRYDINNRQVLVPIRQRDKAYMLLASENLLTSDSHTGFEEMLKQVNQSTTRSLHRDMMRIALQNELGMMIKSMDQIEKAKVVIDAGRRRVLSSPIKPRASVKITTRRGKVLTQKVADAIIALVSASKSGLDKQAIVVVDQSARHFYARDDDSSSGWSAERLSIQRREEELVRNKVENAVRQFSPGAEVFAFVNIEFDLDQKGSKTHEIIEGVVKTQKNSKQEHLSEDAPGAETGANPNLARASAPSRSGKKSKSSIKTAEKTMENGWKLSHHEIAPGDVEEMSVSVVMHLPYMYKKDDKGEREKDDKGNPVRVAAPILDETSRTELATFISRAIGLKSVRDVSIRQVAWSPPLEPEQVAVSTASFLRDIAVRNLTAVVLAGLAIGGLIMIWSQVRRVIPADELINLEEEIVAPPTLPAFTDVSDQDRANASFEQMRNRISDIVDEDPKKAASLIKRWMIAE